MSPRAPLASAQVNRPQADDSQELIAVAVVLCIW